MDYLQTVKDRFPEHFQGRVVLEFGSKNINGTPRGLFTDCSYIGLNRDEGKDVDVVSRMHEYEPGFEFGTIISTSTLEHDKYVDQSMQRCWDLLAPGGLLVVTTVVPSWGAHNIKEGEDNHYEGIAIERARGWLDSWLPVDSELLERDGNLLLYARKGSEPPDQTSAPDPTP